MLVAHQPEIVHQKYAGIHSLIYLVVNDSHQSDGVLSVSPHLEVGIVSAQCHVPFAVFAERLHVEGIEIGEKRTTLPWVIFPPTNADTQVHVGVKSFVQIPCAQRAVVHPYRGVPDGRGLQRKETLAVLMFYGVRYLCMSFLGRQRLCAGCVRYEEEYG